MEKKPEKLDGAGIFSICIFLICVPFSIFQLLYGEHREWDVMYPVLMLFSLYSVVISLPKR